MEPICPLCSSQQSTLFDQRKFRGQAVINHLCGKCGLVFQPPRMTDEELTRYYQSDYRLEYQGEAGPNAKDLAMQRGRADSLTQLVKDRVARVRRHLDIGSSAGILLLRIQGVYECQSVGVEPGGAYRQYAQEAGLKVYASLEALKEAGEAPFDLISMAHVLEHLPKPVETLADLRASLLSTDGHLLIEVPNLYAHNAFETAHLVSYSPHTLRQMLQKAGFALDMIETHGRPRSAVIPLYLTALAHPADQAGTEAYRVEPERGVARKRKLGMLRRKLLTRLMPGKAWLQPEKTE